MERWTLSGGELRKGNRPAAEGAGASRARIDRASFVMLRERLGRVAMRAGWAGLAGIVLLAVAVVGGRLGAAANEERRVALTEERARVVRSETQPTPETDDRERLKAFYGRFPPATDLPVSLRRLHDHATAHGIRLQRTDYNSAASPATPLTQVTLNIPVQGEAAALYGWLAELLRDMPELALESVTLKRATTDASEVEAEVRMQLYLRGRS